MTIKKIAEILNAEFICCEEFADREVYTACGSDMMSDVLAYVKDQAVLITGLCNPQVVRTAEMMDMVCIVFVRGKRPSDEAIELAKSKQLVMLATPHRMFTACGMLYAAGLNGGTCYE